MGVVTMQDKTQTARKDLGDNEAEGVVAGINRASAVERCSPKA
jgi:hypothetical protein